MQRLLDFKKKDVAVDTSEQMDEIDLENLNQELQEAAKTKEFEERRAELEVRKQMNDISNMEHLVEIAALKLREKAQEFRLWELKIKELKRQTKHTALKPLDYGPSNSQSKISGINSNQEVRLDSTIERSENSNIREQLQVRELTQENVKLLDKQLYQDEDSEFYSNLG